MLVRQACRRLPLAQRERELRSAELEVVPPLRLAVEVERDHRQELLRVGVREGEDVLRVERHRFAYGGSASRQSR